MSGAQPAKVGYLGLTSPESAGHLFAAFQKRLFELGWVEGQTISFERRWALGETASLPTFARELVDVRCDAILASSRPTVAAVQAATRTIPIVMANITDPVRQGLVDDLSHPGGNTTGVSTLNGDISPKLLELLLAVVPQAPRAGLLWNPSTSAEFAMNVERVAASIRLDLVSVRASSVAEIGVAFDTFERRGVGGVVVLSDGVFLLNRQRIAGLAKDHKLPTVFSAREYVEAGGLLGYGTNPSESFRRAAEYVDKILKGAKPGDLPIEQSSHFEMTLNARTAKALGIAIPSALLVRVDQVIE